MANKGFSESVQTQIAMLKNNLNDRYYQGFPVIKELLANADDAKATRVHLGWCQGPDDAQHPLLDRPGIFVVNDGPFRTVDEEGIRRLGQGSRGADDSTIGRFGLGLKSVFHLCDSLFYMASGYDGNRVRPVFDILNPWSDETMDMHNEWDEINQKDGELLRNLIAPCCDTADWFAIWLPLRCKRDGNPFIMNEFHGEQGAPPEDFLGSRVVPRIASLLPLLSSIQSVHLWQGCGLSMRELSEWAECVILPGANRRKAHEALREGDRSNNLSGEIYVSRKGKEPGVFTFNGIEKILADGDCLALQEHPKWPRGLVLDPDSLEFVDRPEKATAHVAVHIIRSPSQSKSSALELAWASYLPVGEPQAGDQQSIEESIHYNVILHGVFFVDSGRRVIDFEVPLNVKNERAVRQRWNALLKERGVLPLLIPCLDQAASRRNLSTSELTAITSAISRTDTLKSGSTLDEVCRNHQWLVLVHDSSLRWSMVDSKLQVLELPIFESLEKTLASCPSLNQVADLFSMSPTGFPRLCVRELSRQWPAEAIKILLESHTDLDYLNGNQLATRIELLCKVAGGRFPDETVPAVRSFIVQLLERRKLIELSEFSKLLSSLCQKVHQGNICGIPLPCNSKIATSILRAANVAASAHGLVFVPNKLIGDSHDQPIQLRIPVAHAVLEQLALCEERVKLQPHFAHVASHVISSCEDKDELLKRCGDLQLFRDERGAVERTWSAIELQCLQAESRLAVVKSDSTQKKWQEAVISAINSDLAFVHANVSTAVFDGNVPVCNGQWVISLLVSSPLLAAEKSRVALLSMLIQQKCDLHSNRNRTALRYLLTGNDHPDSANAVLLEPRSAGEQDVWDRIASVAMKTLGERWRLLDSALVSELPGVAKQALGIEAVDAKGVSSLLGQVSPSTIDWSAFNTQDRSQLLVEVEDETLLRSLPIHETTDGQLVTIGTTTFLSSAWSGRVSDVAALCTQLREPVSGRARDRLARLADAFDEEAVVRVALASEEPSKYWSPLMEAAVELFKSREPPRALVQKLKESAWLPTINGNPISPDRLLNLPYEAGEVALSIIRIECPLQPLSSLIPPVVGDTGFRVCRKKLLKSLGEQLSAIALHLSDAADAAIGLIKLEAEDAMDDWLRAFDGAEGVAAMPAVELLSQFKSKEGRRLCVDVLLPKIYNPISDERLLRVLLHLGTFLESSSTKNKGATWSIYIQYLGMIRDAERPTELIQKLKLPARDGSWRQAAMLSLDAHGIAESHLLHKECARSLDAFCSQAGQKSQTTLAEPQASKVAPENLAQEVRQSMSKLKAYFAPWARIADEELVRALLALLGGDPILKQLRQNYIDQTKLDVFLNSLAWTTHEGSLTSGASESLEDMLNKQRYILSYTFENTINVISLVGDRFNAPVSSSTNTLLLGERSPSFVGSYKDDGFGMRVYELRLQELDPSSFGRQGCNEILRETARSLLTDVYCRTVPNFDDQWDHLSSSDQIDMEFTRDCLLREAPSYLAQLGLRTDPVLGPVLQDLKDAEYRKHLEEHEEVAPAQRKGAALESRQRKRLSNLLLKDDTVAESVHMKVREKVSEKDEYKTDSVPFELFQNADDAVTELSECHEPHRELLTEERHWAAIDTSDGLLFLHRGRCINQKQLGDANRSDRGFGQDLQKMLVLQSSDKQQVNGAVPVTGKFGLGFKSAFLVSDEPRIRSGRLRCRIRGAYLPLHDEQEYNSIKRFFETRNRSWRPTAVILPLRSGLNTTDILSRFASLCSLQLVFARSIRSCEISSDSYSVNVTWQGEDLPSCPRLECGVVHSTPKLLPQGLRAVLCRASADQHEREGVLFLIGRLGFVSVPDPVPTIWVTTPTQENLDIGVLVNGRFSVHTGRARLADHPELNMHAAESLASSATPVFSQFIEHCLMDWQVARESLYLDDDLKLADLWNSLWAVAEHVVAGLAKSGGHVSAPIVARAVWSPESGVFSHAVTRYPITPSDLPEPFDEFICGADVRCVVDEWLASRKEIVVAVLKFTSLHHDLRHNNTISKRVWSTLKTALPDGKDPMRIGLSSAIRSEIEHDPRFDAARARTLSFVRNAEVQSHLKENPNKDLNAAFQDAEFLAMSGKYEPANRLLIRDGKGDESLRAAFAPPHRVLSSEYDKECIDFFKLCRNQMRATEQELAEWIANCAEGHRRNAVEYLIKGELKDHVCDSLMEYHPYCWVFNLEPGSSELERVEDNKAGALLAYLKVYSLGSFDKNSESKPDHNPIQQLDPSLVLHGLSEWWATEQQEQLETFHDKHYPAQFDPAALAEWDPSNTSSSSAWLTVFLLGSFHTMGRCKPEQHKSFLEQCARDGWLDRFASESNNPAMWGLFLEDFFAPQTQDAPFLQWMLQLPRIYVLSRWLPEYIEAFLSINRPGEVPEPAEILASRASSRFQGGGVDAPPVKSVLGLGYCFILRELHRHGAIQNTDVAKDCFVPVRRVRSLTSSMGARIDVESSSPGQSREIQRFLVEHLGEQAALFDGAFDIPLQILASNKALQIKLTGNSFKDEGGVDAFEW